MNFIQTTNCIVCGEPAKSFTGHVHGTPGKHSAITVGWCGKHNSGEMYKAWFADKCDCPIQWGGCCGQWEPYMGIEVKRG